MTRTRMNCLQTKLRGRKQQRSIDRRIKVQLKNWVQTKGYTHQLKGLDEVAEQIGYSPEQLGFFCRSVLGEPFLTFRKELRIKEACRIIERDPEIPLSEIGSLVGIPNKSNFRTQFREVVGMTPAEYSRFVRFSATKRLTLRLRSFYRKLFLKGSCSSED